MQQRRGRRRQLRVGISAFAIVNAVVRDQFHTDEEGTTSNDSFRQTKGIDAYLGREN
jgi:hypothetical protein